MGLTGLCKRKPEIESEDSASKLFTQGSHASVLILYNRIII